MRRKLGNRLLELEIDTACREFRVTQQAVRGSCSDPKVFRASSGFEIRSVGTPEYRHSERVLYVRGDCTGDDHVWAPLPVYDAEFDIAVREIEQAVREYTMCGIRCSDTDEESQ